jgi:hypothetical protein
VSKRHRRSRIGLSRALPRLASHHPHAYAIAACAALLIGLAGTTPSYGSTRSTGVLVSNGGGGTPLVLARRPARGSRRGAQAPLITAEPHSRSVSARHLVSFSAAASGSPAPAVRWQRSTNRGRSWREIAGVAGHGNSLAFIAKARDSGYEYRAIFTNASGAAATTAATLTVTKQATGSTKSAPRTTAGNASTSAVTSTGLGGGPSNGPQVTAQPVSQTVAEGGDVVFSAGASGSPSPAVQWQVSTDAGGIWTDVLGATSTTLTFVATSQNAYEYRALFSNTTGTAASEAATLTVAGQSSNWAGYVAIGATFSAVSGGWIVPSVSCGSSTTYMSQWIGIDGTNSATVEQDGIEADCISGSPYYAAWYEMYGDPNVNNGYEVPLSNSSYPVAPGDAMTASVSLSGTTWTLQIADTTKDWSFSTNIATYTPAPAQSSAEWVVERPQVCSSSCGLAALSDFGSSTFDAASATVAGGTSRPISALNFTPLEMVGSTVLAAPGGLDATGEQFADTWSASS